MRISAPSAVLKTADGADIANNAAIAFVNNGLMYLFSIMLNTFSGPYKSNILKMPVSPHRFIIT